MATYEEILSRLEAEGNLRHIPVENGAPLVDFSTNDYMGLAERDDLRQEFFSDENRHCLPMSSSASRLLAARQCEHCELEQLLENLYGRPCLLFNSGYHANSGIIPALAGGADTLIIADRLSHASIIDGIVLSRARFLRFPHNDYDRLERIVTENEADYERLLVITESVFSMDGDRSDIERLTDIKRRHPKVTLYVDEAHAFGVDGPSGLGLVNGSPTGRDVDIIVGTFGKAAASAGAFAAVSPTVKNLLINRARSFIFSTALPPMTSAWTRFMVEKLIGMDRERQHLKCLSEKLHDALGIKDSQPSHIAPLIVGDAHKAVELSARLLNLGFKALPIRTPTVPPGTERLRFSVSASMCVDDIMRLKNAIAST